MKGKIEIARIAKDFPISEFDSGIWEKAREISIENYWSGEKAEAGRHAKAKLLWSDSAFYICFRANQIEPLIVSDAPNLKTKTVGLWDRDVCEIFIAPHRAQPNKYYEFEVAPTGEWLDLQIYQLSEKRETDFEYDSGMQTAARIEKDKVTTAIKIPWSAFGVTPRFDEVWKGNLFRCVGSGAARGYLAWSPTKTARPSFHAPEAFGDFKFLR